MKKFITGLALMCLIASCQKSIMDDPSKSTSVSSQVTLHDSYSTTIPLHYVDYIPCTDEEIQVEGESVLTGRYLVANGTIRFRGTIQYKHAKAVGLTTGNNYIVNVLQKDNQVVDILIDNTNPQGQFTFTGRAKILSPSNGQAWNASFTVKYSIDFNTGDLTYYKYQFASECR